MQRNTSITHQSINSTFINRIVSYNQCLNNIPLVYPHYRGAVIEKMYKVFLYVRLHAWNTPYQVQAVSLINRMHEENKKEFIHNRYISSKYKIILLIFLQFPQLYYWYINYKNKQVIKKIMETYSLMLSIIVPIYNASKYLNRCIDSILNQGLDENDYEIILINDGSTDNSLSICNRYVDTKPSIIKVIDKLNEGVAAARNCGINHALGKYIYFIDADDYLIPNGLNYIITSFLDDSIDILSFRALTLDKNTKRTFVEDNNIEGKICKECTGKEFLYRSVQAFVFTSLYKRSFLQEHYLFFERISIGEDLFVQLKSIFGKS